MQAGRLSNPSAEEIQPWLGYSATGHLQSASSGYSTIIFEAFSGEPQERIRGFQRIASLSLEIRQSA